MFLGLIICFVAIVAGAASVATAIALVGPRRVPVRDVQHDGSIQLRPPMAVEDDVEELRALVMQLRAELADARRRERGRDRELYERQRRARLEVLEGRATVASGSSRHRFVAS